MADNPELGRRLRDAKRAWEQRHDADLTWRELGERIGAAMGRDAFAYQVVQRWFQLGREPAEFVDTLAAIARVLEADPRELPFGEHPGADADRAAALAAQHEQARRVRETYERNQLQNQPRTSTRKRAAGDDNGTS